MAPIRISKSFGYTFHSSTADPGAGVTRSGGWSFGSSEFKYVPNGLWLGLVLSLSKISRK